MNNQTRWKKTTWKKTWPATIHSRKFLIFPLWCLYWVWSRSSWKNSSDSAQSSQKNPTCFFFLRWHFFVNIPGGSQKNTKTQHTHTHTQKHTHTHTKTKHVVRRSLRRFGPMNLWVVPSYWSSVKGSGSMAPKMWFFISMVRLMAEIPFPTTVWMVLKPYK